MAYYPTPVLTSLVTNRHLKRTVTYIFEKNIKEILLFLLAVFREKGYDISDAVAKEMPVLKAFGLISEHRYPVTKNKSSLNFVEAVNFELTYQCNFRCPHCLQNGLDKDDTAGMLSGEQVYETIKIAKVLGLLKAGVNFTGGEILGRRDDLFDILEAVHRLKIPFRLNTNSWWAGRKDLTIAGKTFKDGAELIRYIKSLGCVRIAFSFDKRYHGSIDSAPGLVESIRICENEGMPYEVI